MDWFKITQITLGILNSSTVAAVITVLLGLYFFTKQYKKQKEIDRIAAMQSLLIDDAIFLMESIKKVILILQQVYNTSQMIGSSEGDHKLEKMTKILEESDTLMTLAHLINDEIPLAKSKLEQKIGISYGGNGGVVVAFEKFENYYDRWFKVVARDLITSKTFDFTVSPHNNEKINPKEIFKSLEDLIRKLQKGN